MMKCFNFFMMRFSSSPTSARLTAPSSFPRVHQRRFFTRADETIPRAYVRRNYPISLAWAPTIDASEGAAAEAVYVDVIDSHFSHGAPLNVSPAHAGGPAPRSQPHQRLCSAARDAAFCEGYDAVLFPFYLTWACCWLRLLSGFLPVAWVFLFAGPLARWPLRAQRGDVVHNSSRTYFLLT